MEWTNQSLIVRARRAYELGRLRRALSESWAVGLVVAVGALCHRNLLLVAVAGAVLLIATTLLSWRGQVWRQAIWPGFTAGAVPLVVPSLAPVTSVCYIGGSCWSVCSLLCPLSGFIAGLGLGALATRQEKGNWQMLLSSAFVAAATGTIGCALAGALGIAGMIVGGSLGFVPVYLGAKIAKEHP